MPAIFVNEGDALDFTPGTAVTGGDVIVQGELVGVARLDIAANELGAIAVAGVFKFNKATGGGSAIGVGLDVFYDVAEDVAKTDDEAGANKLIGKTILATVDADDKVKVRMSQ